MYKCLLIVVLFYFWQNQAQDKIAIDSLYKPDPYYLEDQFYFGMSYIALKNLPGKLEQNGFSNSVKFGYIRDIPMNERRNLGFGIGLGMGWDTYFQNLRISIDEETGNVIYRILNDDNNYQSNSFTLTKIEFPVELRWRGSSPTKFKFWRLYAGPVFSFVVSTASEYVNKNVDVKYQNIRIIDTWQTGISVSIGYGTWNF